jgi:hypothetical protein
MEQHGLCPLCNAFYFIQSATTGFTVSTFPYRSRVSLKEAFAGLEPDEYESLTSGSLGYSVQSIQTLVSVVIEREPNMLCGSLCSEYGGFVVSAVMGAQHCRRKGWT